MINREETEQALREVADLPTNVEEAWSLAIFKRHESNLARAYLRLLAQRPEEGMTEARAREILKDMINERDGGLYNLGHYIAWTPGDPDATLDNRFTPDELEAVAWWMPKFMNIGEASK